MKGNVKPNSTSGVDVILVSPSAKLETQCYVKVLTDGRKHKCLRQIETRIYIFFENIVENWCIIGMSLRLRKELKPWI